MKVSLGQACAIAVLAYLALIAIVGAAALLGA